MANLKKVLASGAELDITLSSFAEGNKLLKAVMKEITNIKVNLGISENALNFGNTKLNDDAVNTIKNIITSLISSEEVESALWVCMGRATYNNQRVTKDLFEDETIRQDYIIVMKEVLFYNLLPFFGNLASLLRNTLEKPTVTQK